MRTNCMCIYIKSITSSHQMEDPVVNHVEARADLCQPEHTVHFLSLEHFLLLSTPGMSSLLPGSSSPGFYPPRKAPTVCVGVMLSSGVWPVILLGCADVEGEPGPHVQGSYPQLVGEPRVRRSAIRKCLRQETGGGQGSSGRYYWPVSLPWLSFCLGYWLPQPSCRWQRNELAV